MHKLLILTLVVSLVSCGYPTQPTQEIIEPVSTQPEVIIQKRVVLSAQGLAPGLVVQLVLNSLFELAEDHTGKTVFLLEDLKGAEITGVLKHGSSSIIQDVHMTTISDMQFSSKQAMLDALISSTPFRCEIRMLGWPLADTSNKPIGQFSVTSRIEGKWR